MQEYLVAAFFLNFGAASGFQISKPESVINYSLITRQFGWLVMLAGLIGGFAAAFFIFKGYGIWPGAGYWFGSS